jgi:hypothetical protein
MCAASSQFGLCVNLCQASQYRNNNARQNVSQLAKKVGGKRLTPVTLCICTNAVLNQNNGHM